jgi:hypothetical protein
MPRGPLPTANARRTNKPAIPPTLLPAEGRKGRPPAVPAPYRLGRAGRAWWNAAWKTPQATKWDAGAVHIVARRATLEDDLATLDHFEPFDIEEFLGVAPNEATRELGFAIGRLKGLAGGRIGVMKEMRELDRQLGLGPKAMADLRWSIGAPKTKAGASGHSDVPNLAEYRDRLG